jgi:hypothetical protein
MALVLVSEWRCKESGFRPAAAYKFRLQLPAVAAAGQSYRAARMKAIGKNAAAQQPPPGLRTIVILRS